LGGLIGTILQTIQLITGTLRRNECLTKGSPLDILPRIMFNIIISSLSLLPLVITEKLARQKLHVPPLTAVETGLMVAPAAIASIKKYFRPNLYDILTYKNLGCRDSRNCRWSSQVFLCRDHRLPRFDPCHLPSRQIKGRLVKARW
jgi:hypothetical protein